MKKFLFLSMLCIITLSGFSCDKQSDQLTPEPEPIGLGQLPTTHQVAAITQPEYPQLVGKFCMAITFEDITVAEWAVDGFLMEDGSILEFDLGQQGLPGVKVSDRAAVEQAITKTLTAKGYHVYACLYDYNSLDTDPLTTLFWLRLHTNAPVKAVKTTVTLGFTGQPQERYYALLE